MRLASLGLVSIATAVLFAPAAVEAQTLSFRPQRIVIDGRTSTASLTLSNGGKSEASYRIELVDVIYNADGSVTQSQTTPAGHPSAKNLIRFSPSQVRLGPGQQQAVRILVRPPEGLAAGEYRVHAVLHQLPDVSNVKVSAAPKGQVTGVLGIEQAVAIPVIVRRGQTSATGTISAMKVVDGKPLKLDLSLARDGNRSLYTNLLLKDKAGAVAAEVKGVAVPVPNKTRRFFFALNEKVSPAALKAGGYTLEMVDHDTGAVIDKKPVK